jgi:adenylosuccinate synthase
MSNCAIVGVNWGDEGKGRMVDLITENYDIVIRYQGGGNAGHTIINEFGKFALHLLPSGIFRKNVVNILGPGVALDPENLLIEIKMIVEAGIKITPENLKISDRCSILFPWHRKLDELEENRLKDKKYGSTKQGIAPFYSDKYAKKSIMLGELFDERFPERLKDLLEFKNLYIENFYKAEPYTYEEILQWVKQFCEPIKPFIFDIGNYLDKAVNEEHKGVVFEAQLGSLRDLDFGIYPYTTSSNTLSSYAPIGSGAPFISIDQVIGVAKAYSTCVGEGPFVTEFFGKEAEELREFGLEYGAKTGRPRRVGAFDVVATRYGVKVQNTTDVALTKLDVLSYLDRIPVCVAYKSKDGLVHHFPFPSKLKDMEPVIEHLPGWKKDITSIRKFEDLPKEAQDYVIFIEERIGAHITYVSVGPERDQIIIRKK